MSFKKAKDLMGLDPLVANNIANSDSYNKLADGKGIANTKIFEAVPNFIKAESERVFSSDGNSWIVLGRDRPASRLSGYGGRGDTQASSVDIVVGRMSANPREADDEGNKIFVDPDFRHDAARIHISQKSDIDRYLRLRDGKVGSSKAKSSVAVKADAVRLVGREGIKLVTKTDPKNSGGGRIQSVKGIDLIAGNNDANMQPLVKGDNMRAAFKKLVDHVHNLTGIVETFLTSQMKFNAISTAHVHPVPIAPGVTTPSVEMVSSGIMTTLQQTIQTLMNLPMHRTNLETFKMNYLEQFGSKYINSRYNHTN